MNHLIIRDLLRQGQSPAILAQRYNLNISRHRRHHNLIQFKYDRDADFRNPIVRQCRGLILDDSTPEWKVVARPFDKFFNENDPLAAQLDWKTARVMEKMDGSCVFLYHYDGWHVATLGSADASGSVGPLNCSFKDLFWATLLDLKLKTPPDAFRSCTFIFELCAPENKVVVQHEKRSLTLIGVRENETGQEADIRKFNTRWPVAVEHGDPGKWNIDDMKSSFDAIKGASFEGYVVVDDKFRRIKVKHPEYVALHRLKDSLSMKNMLELVRQGQSEDFLVHFPEWTTLFTELKDSYWELAYRIVSVWQCVEDINDRKLFADFVKPYPFSGILFALRDNKVKTVLEGISKVRIEKLITWLKIERPAEIGEDVTPGVSA